MHRQGDVLRRGGHRDGGLQPPEGVDPAQRARVRLRDAPRGHEAARRANRPNLCAKCAQVRREEIARRPCR